MTVTPFPRSMSKNRRAFTLIELMIVMTIIATIATIAIPSLLRSRMTANEISAVTALRSIATAQTLFIRANYPFTNSGGANMNYKPGVKQFAPRYIFLYDYALPTPVSGSQLELIPRNLAQAYTSSANYGLGVTQSYRGYLFRSLFSNQTAAYDYSIQWGASATPEGYDFSGVNTFVVTVSGVIYQRDFGTAPVILSSVHDDPTQWGYSACE